ncbi:MAG: putative GST-like protein YibF [Steroidobacteraceae bacterium]|nr:putative GST-like protein YibF [Steroidobacteraceae bacterium]
MQIIGTATSPYTRKVRVVALEKGIGHEFVASSPMVDSAEVQAANPLGKVPVLVRDDGSRLVDSPLIAEYLDGLNDAPRLIPRALAAREAVRQLEAIADGVLDAAILVRMESLRPEALRSNEWISWEDGKVHRGLAHLERAAHGRRFLIGDALTLADIALACCLAWLEFRFAEQDWRSRYPAAGRHAEEMLGRPSFAATPVE